MKIWCVVLGVLLSRSLYAQMIQSDCSPSEVKILAAADMATYFGKKGTPVSSDCALAKGSGKDELLIVTFVFNTPTGYESYLCLFERNGFSGKSAPIYKSAVLGFDLFPLLVDQKYRQIFLHPATDKTRIVMFLNVQTAPGTSRLSRWDYIFEKKELSEGAKVWMLEAGVLPKVYEDSGVVRALLGARSVEI